jgi:four helix bundle protein
MASLIKCFEDLECWKSARSLNRLIFKASEEASLAKDWDTRSQLRRASLSIMNNIAEGFGRYHDKDQVRFFDIARASANEVKSMLYVLEDLAYLPPEQLLQLHKEVDAAHHLTTGWIRYLSQRK